MTNTILLKAIIVENGQTIKSFAKEIGMSYQSFNRKLHNKRRFTAPEISVICFIKNIANVADYF